MISVRKAKESNNYLIGKYQKMPHPGLLALLALLLLSEIALPTHSLGLRRQQITHTIEDLNQLRQQLALKTESSNAAKSPRFVQLDVSGGPVESTPTNGTIVPPLTDAASLPQPRSPDPFTNSIPADHSTVVSTAAVAPPSFLPNTASLDSASASNFPSQCAQRPKKEPLTAADISCMTKHTSKAHGRYICPLRCPIGSPLSKKGTSCLCGPCWEGTTCQAPKCAHGEEVGCPNHGTHCHHDERTCLCPVKNDGNPSYTGKHCEHKFDPNAISAKEASLEAQKKVQAKEQALKDQQLAAEALISEVCNGMACDGLSMLNTTSCECVCTPPWTGETCGSCPACLSPLHSPDYDNNCQCACSDQNITCNNEGYLNKETCGCTCVNHFSGKDCSECKPLPCENDGEFNDDLCSCLCPKGWKGKTCNVCDETTTCENGGVLNKDTCTCQCNVQNEEEDKGAKNGTTAPAPLEKNTHWKGDFCETCPSASFVDCGPFEFDHSTCACTQQCESVDCQHDSVLDPTTCACKCNNGVNVTDPKVLQSWEQLKGITFYAEDDCGTCAPPQSGCPGGRTFNNGNCTCDDACLNPPKCSAAERNGGDENTKVLGDGILNTDTCTCDCAPGWGGLQCDQIADGSTQMLASVSCQAAMTVIDEGPNGPASSGMYWINPSGTDPMNNGFQVNCDMSILGEGWTQLGNIDPDVPMTISAYEHGRNEHNIQGFHVLACDHFHGLDGSDMELRNVIVKLVMGNITDYYRPRNGATLCEMLQSNNQHQWWVGAGQDVEFQSPTKFPGGDEQGIGDEEGVGGPAGSSATSLLEIQEDPEETKNYEWITPTYEQDPKLQSLLGGSNRTWALKYDGRAYLSFWGGDEAVNGGCCYDDSKWFRVGACSSNVDIPCFDDGECRINEETSSATCIRKNGPRKIGWGKGFQMYLREVVLPGEGKGIDAAALDHQKDLESTEAGSDGAAVVADGSSFLEAKEEKENEKLEALKSYNRGNTVE